MDMSRNRPSRLAFLVPGITCLALAGVLASELLLFGKSDRFWTPPAIAYSLQAASGRVEIYLDGKLLQDRLAAGELSRSVDGTKIGPQAVTVRLNDRYRITWIRVALLAATLTAGVVLVLVSVVTARRRPPLDLG